MATKTHSPYYGGRPVEISPVGWALLVASVMAAFLLLIFLPG